MSAERRFGDTIANSMGMRNAPAIVTRGLRGSPIAVTRIVCGPEHLGLTLQVPPEDTFILAVYLTRLERHELGKRGQPFIKQGYAEHSMRIVHLGGDYAANIIEPHEALSFYMPRAVLDDLSREDGGRDVNMLACSPGVVDSTIAGIAMSLKPHLSSSFETSQLCLDYLTFALGSHLVKRFSEGGSKGIRRGGLSTRHARFATELLASLAFKNPSLADIARECGLSRGHFIKAFTTSTGLPPHRWLTRYRVDQVKQLLWDSNLSIAEISVRAGFADQSHLTRVFTKVVGDTPARWRRTNRSFRSFKPCD